MASFIAADLNIYRSANVLIHDHGQDAPIQAAMKADAMLDKGDLDGAAAWRRITPSNTHMQLTRHRSSQPIRVTILAAGASAPALTVSAVWRG